VFMAGYRVHFNIYP